MHSSDEPADSAPMKRPDRSFALAAMLLVAMATPFPVVYFGYFSVFSNYDDEGYMMATVGHFLAGERLYDDVPTLYGPFYYVARLFVHGFLRIDLSNVGVRWASMSLGIAASSLAGLAAWRVTRRSSLAVLVYAVTLLHLRTMSSEPGHPQDLCAMLVAAAAAIATYVRPDRPARVVGLLGAIVACLMLTKVNIGLFAGASIGLALMSVTEGRLARWASAAMLAATVALPLLLIRRDAGTEWGAGYILAVGLGLLSLAVHTPPSPRPISAGMPRVAIAFCAGLAGGAVVPIAIVVARGTSVGGLLDAMLWLPLRLASAFAIRATFMSRATVPALLSFGMAVAFRLLSGRLEWRERLGFAAVVLKAGFGAVVLALSLTGRLAVLMAFGTPFLWLILVPSSARPARPEATIARTILGFLAVLQALQAYPVAGTQVVIGTILHLLVGAVCLGDALDGIELRLGASTIPGRLARAALPLGAALLVAASAVLGLRAYRNYRGLVPMSLVGGRAPGRIRIDEKRVATFRWLVSNLTRSADTFLCTTGFNSLYGWTGVGPPTKLVIGNSLEFYTAAQQGSIARALGDSPDACVIDHPSFFTYIGVGLGPPGPLLAEVRRSYVSLGEVDGFDFRVRAGRDLGPLVDCVRMSPADPDGSGRAEATLIVSPVPGRSIRRACLSDTSDGSILADTLPSEGAPTLLVRDAESRQVVLPHPISPGQGLDLSATRTLSLVFPSLPAPKSGRFLVVRLLGEGGEVVASLPFLKERGRSE